MPNCGRSRRVDAPRRTRSPWGSGCRAYVEITGADSSGDSGRVDINPDGSVTAYTGVSPHGQGIHTTLAMLLSDRLGVPMERITVRHGDTDEVPKGVGTMGSRSLQFGGSAIRKAADEVIEKARRLAADALEASVDDSQLDVENRARGASAGPQPPVRSVGRSWRPRPSPGSCRRTCGSTSSHRRSPSAHHPGGGRGGQLLTGKVVLRRTPSRWTTPDPILNPVTFRGQRHGGLAQGVAQALLEVMDYDADGNPTTATLADYSFITATELPDFELVDMGDPHRPQPVRGQGHRGGRHHRLDPPVQNAVVDALAHLGVTHIDMPTTPMRVWEALAQETRGEIDSVARHDRHQRTDDLRRGRGPDTYSCTSCAMSPD